MNKTVINLVHNSNQMEGLGGCVAKSVLKFFRPGSNGICLLLYGSVGVGKSVFARGFIRSMIGSPAEIVPSPSFMLEQTYSGPQLPFDQITVRHFDLYRLQDKVSDVDLQALGLPQALKNDICLIEWPEKGK
mmetsp:Transcript_8938/g.11646  ORF Transcript_8938/g.11646 Transcript_8938/m.11646 type:complete len:132 (-) Transcript_8938:22-417(-)